MRLLLSMLLCCACGVAIADSMNPDDLPPIPAPPKLEMIDDDADVESQVTITRQTEQTIEEYRVGGKLYMIKITPKVGPPYYLVDERGDGKFARQESLDYGFRPPRWVIHNF